MGYRFEAGTVFTSNSWHIAQNEAEYKDATVFNPERYTSLPPLPLPPSYFKRYIYS
jgi:cytochrome P450